MWATGRRTGTGFTLLELLVVLALVALLATALPIAFRHLIPGQQLKVATIELAGELRALQTKSALTGEKQEFRVEHTRMSGGISVELAAPGNALRSIDAIEFFPDGSSSGGRLTLVLGERRSELLVSALTGRVAQVSP